MFKKFAAIFVGPFHVVDPRHLPMPTPMHNPVLLLVHYTYTQWTIFASDLLKCPLESGTHSGSG